MSCVRSFLFSLMIVAPGLATASPAAKAATNRQLAQVEANRPPTHFEPNLGQNPAGVRFSARGRGAGASFLFSTVGERLPLK